MMLVAKRFFAAPAKRTAAVIINGPKRYGNPDVPNIDISQYKNPSTRNYAYGDAPFPMNPYFKPIPPVSDATRTAVFDQYKEDPAKWTPRALAEQYGLSIVRIEAILRLKALQAKMELDNVQVYRADLGMKDE
jgi:Eukaryotic mitochondrial regulator protein